MEAWCKPSSVSDEARAMKVLHVAEARSRRRQWPQRKAVARRVEEELVVVRTDASTPTSAIFGPIEEKNS